MSLAPHELFAPLLDTRHMTAAFRRHLPECLSGEWELTGCAIEHPRYKTYLSEENRERSSLALLYHLNVRRSARAAAEPALLYARAFLGERSQAEFETARAGTAPERRHALLHMPELGLVGWRFPQDPAMPWLEALLSPEHSDARIPGLEAPVEIQVINYRPEIRCTVRYRLRGEGTAPRTVYGKTYADGAGCRIHENLQALRRQSNVPGCFVLPEPLAYDAERRTLWLDGLQGEPLLDALVRYQDASLITPLCRGLARLQHQQVPQGPTLTADEQLQEWRKKARKLAHAYPALAPDLSALTQTLAQQMPAAAAPVLIHGDFHAGQLAHMPDGRMALFDFDELAWGDPMFDLANFVSDLFVQPMDDHQRLRLAQQLLACYQRHAPRPDGIARFIWQLRGQLLTRAYRAFIQQKADTQNRVTRLLASARQPYETGWNA